MSEAKLLIQKFYEHDALKLNEVTLTRELEKRVVKRLWAQAQMDDMDTLLYYYRADNNYDDNEDEDENDASSPEFKSWFEAFMLRRIYDIFSEITYRIKSNKLSVFRKMTLPANWTPDMIKYPGVYWSWDEHAAEAHWGNFGYGHETWLLIGEVGVGAIDWVTTLAANADMSTEEEKEITIMGANRVKIIKSVREK